MKRKLIYSARVGALILILALAFIAAPVEACGCGIYIPHDGDANVSQERALVRWDGRTEDIVMGLGVAGSSKEAAWILPVPSRATAKLGDAKLFSTLQELTKPRLEKQYALPTIMLGGASAPPAAGSAPVTLLERQTLGPFDVSTLAASDANALGDWLKTNGYNFSPQLANVLQPYVAQNWYYVAVKLTPGASGQALQGLLDPLWVTFDSDKIIYPMRASSLARSNLSVLLYVLAEHRVKSSTSFGSSSVKFADWVEPSALEQNSALAPFVPRKSFLTKYQEQIYNPSQIKNDFTFSFAASDETYHEIQYEYVYDFAGVPIVLWLFCLVCVLPAALLLLGIIFLVRRARRRPARRRPARRAQGA